MNKSSTSKSFSIEAVVSCDERGQLVLPKDLRRKLGIKPGDKMALMNFSLDKEQFCLTLIRTDALNQLVKIYLDPLVQKMKE